MALINLSEKFTQIKQAVEKVSFADVQLPDVFKSEYEKYLGDHAANGYSKVEWAKFSTKITTSSGKVIFLTNFWFYIASELAVYLEGLVEQKDIFKKIYEGEDLQKAATSLRDGVSEINKEKIKTYFDSNSLSNDDYACFLTFVADYPSWGGGKTIDRNDYYVSPLLQAGNLLAETQSAIAEIAKQFSESLTLKNSFSPIFMSSETKKKNGSALISENTRGQFVYELIDFLVDNKIEFPFFQCLVEKNRELGSYNIEYKECRLTSIFKISNRKVDGNELQSGDKLRFFIKPFEIDSRFYYLSNQWTDGTESRLDIQTLISIFHALYSDYRIIENDGVYVLIKSNIGNITSPLSKPFLLLAGISGTGKTHFVREQAKSNGSFNDTYCLTSVRPDWHEPSDLLGYTSRLTGQAEYITTDVLQFIAQAWRAMLDAGLTLQLEDVEEYGERLVVAGDSDALKAVLPFWLCLDEMNLAPVEQYFADYLSVSETREWRWQDESFTYMCDPLLKAETIAQVADKDKLRSALGFNDAKYDDAWTLFCQCGLSIPFNLIVAGTVNMDETTHGFSRKVIDRALSFDFGAFFPNDFDQFFAPTTHNKTLSYPILSHARLGDLSHTIDVDGKQTIAFLATVNQVLDNTSFKLAYRALNELLLAVINQNPQDALTLQAVWDDFLMCKVLPRIEGDSDKLGSTPSLLQNLTDLLSREFADFWDKQDSEPNARPDLYREKTVGDDKLIRIACRSKAKLAWMQKRLVNAGFTSFWP